MVEPSQDFITTVEESAEGTGNDSAPQSSKTSNKRTMPLDDDDSGSQTGDMSTTPEKISTNKLQYRKLLGSGGNVKYHFDQFYQYNPDNVRK